MQIIDNAALSEHSTMRLGGKAQHLVEVSNKQELREAFDWAKSKNLPAIVIGDGSNIIWQDQGYPGLVIVNKILGFEKFNEDEENLYITVGAGENWDSVVKRTVELGYSGIEQLSLIPGTTGATPVQNVGAYGREIKDVLVSVEAFDTSANKVINIPAADCNFAYRSSRFNGGDKGRFYITAVTLHLIKTNPQPPFYGSLQSYLDEHGIKDYTAQTIRDAVIAIRQAKLPDPAKVANNGSFFGNPIIDKSQFAQIQADFPDVQYWDVEGGKVKLSAAWLVENAGFKDFHDQETGMATWPKQSLVFVNEHAKTTADLLKFKQKVVSAVEGKFHVKLIQEPELI